MKKFANFVPASNFSNYSFEIFDIFKLTSNIVRMFITSKDVHFKFINRTDLCSVRTNLGSFFLFHALC